MSVRQLLDRFEPPAPEFIRSLRTPQVDAAARSESRGADALVDFSSNDYLGLRESTTLQDAFKQALAEGYGGAGASPLVTGWQGPHARLAATISHTLGTEASLLFSSGYVANLSLLGCLFRRGDRVLVDREVHASIIDGLKFAGVRIVRYRHNDVDHARRLLGGAQPCVALVTDGLFSMSGDLAPMAALSALCDETATPLIVDDAHGIGVLGPDGRGVLGLAGIPHGRLAAFTGTFGKAFGLAGAFVSGESRLIQHLVQRARGFTYSTGMPTLQARALESIWPQVMGGGAPSCKADLATIDTGLNPGSSTGADGTVGRDARARLNRNIDLWRRLCAGAGIPVPGCPGPIQPLVIGSADAAVTIADKAREAGLLLTAFRPPTVPPDTSRIRIALSAAHSEADLSRLVEFLRTSLADYAVDRAGPSLKEPPGEGPERIRSQRILASNTPLDTIDRAPGPVDA